MYFGISDFSIIFCLERIEVKKMRELRKERLLKENNLQEKLNISLREKESTSLMKNKVYK